MEIDTFQLNLLTIFICSNSKNIAVHPTASTVYSRDSKIVNHKPLKLRHLRGVGVAWDDLPLVFSVRLVVREVIVSYLSIRVVRLNG